MPSGTTRPGRSPEAMAGALLQRQEITMANLLDESSRAYHSALDGGQLSSKEPMGMNTADHKHMGEDAFRHAYSSARATQELGEPVANLLGRGNEMLAALSRENDSKGTNARDIGMDLHNNRVGREIGAAMGDNATPEQIRDAVVAAGREGKLILSTDDPRALQEYQSQHDMKALSGIHDAYNGAKNFLQEAGDKASGMLDSITPLKEGFQKALGDAFKTSSVSPFFSFSEEQLQQGEQFGKALDPGAVAAVSAVVEFGVDERMTAQEFKEHLGAVAELSTPRDETMRDRGDDETVAEAKEAEAEMEMEMAAS